MKTEYDIIVIGAGLSSLMFLSKMISKKSKLSILVLEQKDSIVRNQSFCVWEGPGLIDIEKEFKLKAKHRWDKVFRAEISLRTSNLDVFIYLVNFCHL